ncbi:MAG: adenylate/guanylate cyclase domain-containing protein, partial [Rhodospirillales bacterium]|nr:adenylate/guanylate cyclase domain-containing protein [Rhodospirillales bacterium]
HDGAASSGLSFREMDLLRVKGKVEPIRIYELLATPAEGADSTFEAQLQFKKGLEAYRRKAWEEADQAFRAVLELMPDDKPARTYLDRIRQFRLTPPLPDWDGVWVLESK